MTFPGVPGLEAKLPLPTFMTPLHIEHPRGPRPRPRSQPPAIRPLSMTRISVALQQESEVQPSMLSQIPHSDAIKGLQSDLHDAISVQSRLMEDIAELLTPSEKSHAIKPCLRGSSTLQNSSSQAVSNESSLQKEIKTLKASLEQARYDHKTLVAKSWAGPSLKQEIESLKRDLAQAVSSETSLMHEVETLKTTLTHALTSEREMRASARQTREEWESVERTLREEINTLKNDLERMRKELKRKKVVPFIQRLVLGAGGEQDVQAGGRGYAIIYLSHTI